MTSYVHSSSPPETSPLMLHTRRLYAAGQRMFAQSEWQAAIRLFELVLQVDPSHLEARRYLGEALLEQGRVKEALQHLRQVYQSDPKVGQDIFRRALTSLAMQQASRQPVEQAIQAEEIIQPTDEPAAEVPPTLTSTTDNPTDVVVRTSPAINAENAGTLHEQKRVGRGRIVSIAYAPDGETLALGSAIGIYLYDLNTFHVQQFLPTSAWVWCLTYDRTGQWLAAGMGNGNIRLWQMNEPEKPLDIPAHQDAVQTLAFSSDGRLIASGARDGMVRLWQISDRTLLRTFAYDKGPIRALAFSPDGANLALAFGHRHIHIRRVRDGALIHTLHGHRQAVRTLTYTSDGRLLASGAEDGHINLWKPGEESPTKTLKDFMGIVTQISFSPDNRTLSSGSWDGSIRLWRPGNGRIWQHLEEQRYPISHCLFSPQGHTLSSLTIHEEVVRIWNVSSGEMIKSLSHNGALTSLAISPQQHYLAAGSGDGNVMLWSYPPDKTAAEVTLVGHQQAVRNLAFDPQGKYLVSAGNDSFLLVWKLSHSAARRIALPDHCGMVTRIRFNAQGEWLFAATENGNIFYWPARKLWETAMLPVIPKQWAQKSNPIEDLVCSPKGDLLAAIEPGRVSLWHIPSKTLVRTSKEHLGTLRCASFSPDGDLLAIGTMSGALHLWDTTTGRLRRSLMPTGTGCAIRSLDFSPDGQVLASSGVDGNINLWEVRTGRHLNTLRGHTQQIWQVAFTPDGKTLLSAGDDGTLRFWTP